MFKVFPAQCVGPLKLRLNAKSINSSASFTKNNIAFACVGSFVTLAAFHFKNSAAYNSSCENA